MVVNRPSSHREPWGLPSASKIAAHDLTAVVDAGGDRQLRPGKSIRVNSATKAIKKERARPGALFTIGVSSL